MEFRIAKNEELEQVMALYQKAIQNMQARGINQWVDGYPDRSYVENDIQNGDLYLLAEGEELLAVASLNEEQEEEYATGQWQGKGRVAVLHRFCINPEYQGQQIGQVMMEAIEKYLTACAYDDIRLDTLESNGPAMKLYDKMGYQLAGTMQRGDSSFVLLEKRISTKKQP